MASRPTGSGFTRRTLLGAAGSAAAVGLLAACSPGNTGGGSGGGGGGGGAGGSLKFWNMPWGGDKFAPADKKITDAYKPESGLQSATYQQIVWDNFTQTFQTAVASNTGPAISSGGGTQAFLFESQGKIRYADDLLDTWRENGLYDDFLPGLVDTLKTDNGYAAVPYNLDMRVLWYNEKLLEDAGADVPTDWDSFERACARLKRNKIYGYGTGSGAGRFTGGHQLTAHMINNGGGLFNADNQPDCVTDANIEAMEWVLGLVKSGYVDPRSPSYTSDNVESQVKARKFGMVWDGAGLASNVGGDVQGELQVTSPLDGPSGEKGALYFPNNIMMYEGNFDKESTEAFATYYYQNMAPLWTEGTGIGLPPLKSIADTDEFKANPINVKIIDEWQPISKTWGAPGTNTVFLNVTTVDGTPAMTTFTQSILGGRTSARSALETLQKALEANAK